MKILEIENKKVKISAHSITVKDDNGKTCGVVRNATRYHELRTSDQLEHWKDIKTSGIADFPKFIDRIVYCDGRVYFLHDLRMIEKYEQMFERFPQTDLEDVKRHYHTLKQVAERAAEFATVIPCYILN